MKYLVIDVYALAYRAFYGYPELTNKDGKPTQVVVGFFKQFLSRIKDVHEYYPIFVADTHNDTYRTELYPQYKANRGKAEDSFYEQVDTILRLGSLIGTVYRQSGYEADDLAAAVVEAGKPEDEFLLVTVDADWLQLLRSNVNVLQLKTNQNHVLWTDEIFFKVWGFIPKQLIDYKALLGDGSDNIPGISGVGDKQVNSLIKEFDSVENLYANIIRVPNKRHLQERLIEAEKQVKLNKKLVTLNSTYDVELSQVRAIEEEKRNQFIDDFQAATDSEDLTNLLGVYVQKR